MGNLYYFDIVPFDPLIVPNVKVHLPIDFDDFVQQVRARWPIEEVRIHKTDEETSIDFYISTKRVGPWVMATFLEGWSDFCVSVWPKSMAKEIILWYRQYIDLSYRLFMVIAAIGDVVELTAQTSTDDIEKMLASLTISDE
jgi:hypothetical protein